MAKRSYETKDEKHDMITRILANDVYMPGSLLYGRLYGHFMTWGLDVLSALQLVLDCKTSTTKAEDTRLS